MAKHLTLANDSLLVGIDEYGHVRDLYFPHVGLQNHISGASGSYTHRIGVWVDGHLAWLNESSWQVEVGVGENGMVGRTHATNAFLGISLHIEDCVSSEKDIFFRTITVRSLVERVRTVRIYFAQQFRLAEDRSGSTGFYDPRVEAIVHYKGPIYFLLNGRANTKGFDEYSVGLFDMESHEGTHIDAQDGHLSKNPIEHGSVDSVIGFTLELAPSTDAEVSYWLAAGSSIEEVHALNAHIVRTGAKRLIRTTKNHWKAWIAQNEFLRTNTSAPSLLQLYERSLCIIRTHMDHRGGIIASSDSDLLNNGRDTYAYVWPRDAAYAACALDVAGYSDTSRKFFTFAASLLTKEGYFMHKYRPDGALGSSWHPWMQQGRPALPIQEDETASILFMLHTHFVSAHDIEYIESLYATLIEPAARFLCAHRDHDTGLPLPSYDLWEEVFGVSTYTSASVYGGLCAAAKCAEALGKKKEERLYCTAAVRVRDAIVQHLYDSETGIFVKSLHREAGVLHKDTTPDMSSLHGLLLFGVLPASDERIVRMVAIIEKELAVPGAIGGFMRYAGDNYFRASATESPNAWIITTLWLAQYYIARAETKADLTKALELLLWTHKRTLPTLVLPEQVHPHTGAPMSATPLVWSHAEYIRTLHAYTEKQERLAE